jgi:glycosyltransferase involved in cell wall biosynthesis
MRKLKANKSRQKVLYLVVNEGITSPLLTRQVTELLAEEVALASGSIEIKILLFQSLTSLVRRWRLLRRLKRHLQDKGVSMSVVPSLVPWPIPNVGFKKTDVGYRPDGTWNRFAARLFSLYAFPFLVYQYFVNRFEIFHSRSYPPALAVNMFQKIFSGVKHVFDPRSDFPEENLTAGRWGLDSRDFLFWKKVETEMLCSAEATACISDEYVEHFKKSAGAFSHFVAPNNVDTRRFAYNGDFRESRRAAIGWSDEDIAFVYLGGMSSGGWHRPEFYQIFLENIRTKVQRAKLLLLIPPHATKIVQECFSGIEGVVIKNPEYDEVPLWLSVADIGLMYLHRRKVAVGTKIGEYLAIGLPIIYNANCLGAVRFVREHPEAGRVINVALGDDDMAVDIPAWHDVVGQLGNRDGLRILAENVFSNETVASAYLRVYEDILQQDEACEADSCSSC